MKWVKVGEIIMPKYEYLMLLEILSDKINLVIDFTDEAVVQCDVPVVKILL